MPRKSKNYEEVRREFVNKVTEIFEEKILDDRSSLDDFTVRDLENILRILEDLKSNVNTFSRLIMCQMRENIKNMDQKKIRINRGVK